MAIITFANTKGSPGATTFALAFSQFLSDYRRIGYCEADYLGGELALLAGMPAKPGLATLAADVLSCKADLNNLKNHLQKFALGFDVILSPLSFEYNKVIERAIADVVELLIQDSCLWVVDAGRINSKTISSIEMFKKSNQTYLVCKNDPLSLVSLKEFVKSLKSQSIDPKLIVIGHKQYSANEIRDAFNIEDVFIVDLNFKEISRIKLGIKLTRKTSVKHLYRLFEQLSKQVEELVDNDQVKPTCKTESESFGSRYFGYFSDDSGLDDMARLKQRI